MKIIGICGSSGAGKSSVCSIFSRCGITVLDCDKIYHKLTNTPSPCLDAIARRFGETVIINGKLDREALRNIVFHDKKALQDLNATTHTFVLAELKESIAALEKEGAKACVIDAPLFFEAKLDTWCDVVCAVIADKNTQISRICERDGIDRQTALLRIEKQISAEELRRRSDYVIENNGNEQNLEEACFAFLEYINL